ncbi:unnamed protein product [Blepharisma stoltei]|uniref:Serine aminopeptidase S33 domain-containing protein n=1 Tax=Blepharisma stoltei TaxID=1481888 RepID=A0AAU9IIY6_9CILI|nr:unnamed protein product [Blepharisma stoltei]
MSEWWRKYEGHVPGAGIDYPEESWLLLKSSKGCKLDTYRYHIPNPQALVFLFHGMHVSSFNFAYTASILYQNNFAVLAFDQESHGNSGGPRGNIRSVDEYVNCGIEYISKAREHYSEGTPVFIIGESMGGAICVNIALQIPNIVTGMILFAPALGINPDLEPWLVKIIRCLACCCPGLPTKPADISMLSRNPYVEQYQRENPVNYNGRLNARTGAALLRAFDELSPQLGNVRVPFILFQGGDDIMVSEQLNKDFVKNSKVEDKELVYYKEMRHDICHEPEIFEITQKIVDWINKRAPSKS